MRLLDQKFWTITNKKLALGLSFALSSFLCGVITKKETLSIRDKHNIQKKIVLYPDDHGLVEVQDAKDYDSFLEDLGQEQAQGDVHVLIEKVLDYYASGYKKITHNGLEAIAQIDSVTAEDIEVRNYAIAAHKIASFQPELYSYFQDMQFNETHIFEEITLEMLDLDFLQKMRLIANRFESEDSASRYSNWVLEQCSRAWAFRQQWALDTNIEKQQSLIRIYQNMDSEQRSQFYNTIFMSFVYLFDLHAFERINVALKNHDTVMVVSGSGHINNLKKVIKLIHL